MIFLEKIKNTIEKYQMLVAGDKVLVGVSGGPDSVALLYVLKLLQKEYRLELYVAHVNHMFRGEEANKEAQFVADLAQSWGIPFQIFTRNVRAYADEKGLSSQDAGHQVRKEIFKDLKKEKAFTKLALGHHGEDRAETLLIHLLQGTGLDGLAAMTPRKGWLIRPLAQVEKGDIIDFCQENKLPYALDPSNNKEIYFRNKVRLSLIPYLKQEFNPKIVESLLKLENIIGEDNDYLTEKVKEIQPLVLVDEKKGKKTIDLRIFNEQHLAIRRRIIREVYKLLRPHSQGITFHHTEQVIQLCLQQSGQKNINLPLNVLMQKGYTTLEFIDTNSKELLKNEFNYQWEVPGILHIPELNIWLKASFSKERPSITPGFDKVVVAAEKTPPSLQVRSREKGDRLQPLGMTGTKKLKDFLIDRKVDKDLRDTIPIVANEGEIIWVPGLTVSEKYKAVASTQQYLILEIEKGEYV